MFKLYKQYMFFYIKAVFWKFLLDGSKFVIIIVLNRELMTQEKIFK